MIGENKIQEFGFSPTAYMLEVHYSRGIMSKSFVIQWKSKVNGRAGRGTKLFDRAEAEELVAELNTEYPQIHHQAVNTRSERHSEQSVSPASVVFSA